MKIHDWTSYFVGDFKYHLGSDFFDSKFLEILINDLTLDFIDKTKIDPRITNKIQLISKLSRHFKYESSYNEFNCKILVNILSLPAKICWKADDDSEIFPNSKEKHEGLHFWFQELKIKEIREEFFRIDKLPFKIDAFKYNIVINQIDDSLIRLLIHYLLKNDPSVIIKTIDEFCMNYNSLSEINNRNKGIIHDFGSLNESINSIEYQIDIGSAPITILKKIFDRLNKIDSITKIEIGLA